MFRIEYLKFTNHPQLGTIELYLSEKQESKNIDKPYTSVIIGPNGTGKSYILRSIAEIFRQFKQYNLSDEKKINIPYDIHLRYKVHHDTYEIATRNLKMLAKQVRREYVFLKNRPLDKPFKKTDSPFEELTGYEITYKDLEFPEKLLVNSVMMNDRFVWQNSNPKDFYQYLGARSTSSTTSTRSSSRRTISHIFGALRTNALFKRNLKELLNFLNFEESLKVTYTTKINKLFFSGSLTKENFRQYYENWWDENFTFSSRKEDNPLWAIPYYKNNLKNNPDLIDKVISYLNGLSNTEGKLKHRPKSSAKTIEIDLFAEDTTDMDIEMISYLENLDIINLDGINIRKSNSLLSIEQVSSGEYHLVVSFIGMFASIQNDSLVLIDEPEISLHPNWQMRYISFLKTVFLKHASCHFILTTHSHFLVSDLEGKSSSVTALSREDDNKLVSKLLYGINTYGWSAEDVLFKIFKVRSNRNHYFEMAVADLLNLLQENSKDYKAIKILINDLKGLSISVNDPLNELITEAENYIAK